MYPIYLVVHSVKKNNKNNNNNKKPKLNQPNKKLFFEIVLFHSIKFGHFIFFQ